MIVYKVTHKDGSRSWHGSRAAATLTAKPGNGKVEMIDSGAGNKFGLLDCLNEHASNPTDRVRTVVRVTASKPPVDDPNA